jgi:TonB-dependent Receptor Plug Domain
MPVRKFSAVFLCLLFICGSIYSQQSQTILIDHLAGNFIKSLRKNPKEKLFVDTDKWFYTAGETMWFKIYSFDELSLRPEKLGKNLFLDLVSDKDSVVRQVLLDVQENKTAASLIIPAAIKEGTYWLRAYSRDILANDTNGIFVKPLYIISTANPDVHGLTDNSKSSVIGEDTSAPQIVFFPEGGSVIAGTTATIAFRATDAKRNPVDLSGWITDTRDSTVATFKTALPGLGEFSFDAWNPRKYFAHIKWKNNQVLTYPLPRISQFATQISLTDQNVDNFKVRVSQSDSLYHKNKTTYILGISRDSLCYAASGTDMYDLNIPKANFPKGRATLYLFDDRFQIVSQRSVFVDTGTTRINMQTDKTNYTQRAKVKLDINALQSDGHPILALFSVSITDDQYSVPLPEENFFYSFNQDNIVLPEADAYKGPGWEKKYTAKETDLIMMVQKNQYSDWKINDTSQSFYTSPGDPDSNMLNIRGTVVSKKGQPMTGTTVYLLSKKKGDLQNEVTDNNGHFVFSVPDYEDGDQFNLKVTNAKGNSIEGSVVLDKFAFPQFPTPKQLKKRFDMSEISVIRRYKSRQPDSASLANTTNLKPVTVNGGKPGAASYDQSKRVSTTSYIITGDQINDGDPNALINAIKNVPGLNTGMTSVSVGQGGNLTMSNSYMVILDGISYTGSSSNDVLNSVNPLQVDFVEILKGPDAAYYGVEAGSGVIIINTISKIREVATVDDKGTATIYPRGYAKLTEFPSPDYDKKEKNKESSFPDLRSTIYWKPDLLTDPSGKAEINFFTADANSTYTASLFGVTSAGELVYKQIKIKRQ